MEYIERAFQDARDGRAAAARPFSDGVIPTTFDKTLNPEGTHIMSLFTQWVPPDWSEQPHTEELDAYTARLIDCYNQVAPGFKSSIPHRDIVGPHEMEQEYGLVGGNIFHGELSLEQLFHMRPAPGYATTAHRSPACTTAVRPPMRAAGCAGSPAGRRPGPRSPTRRRPSGPAACASYPAVMTTPIQPNASTGELPSRTPPPPVRSNGAATGGRGPGVAAPQPSGVIHRGDSSRGWCARNRDETDIGRTKDVKSGRALR